MARPVWPSQPAENAEEPTSSRRSRAGSRAERPPGAEHGHAAPRAERGRRRTRRAGPREGTGFRGVRARPGVRRAASPTVPRRPQASAASRRTGKRPGARDGRSARRRAGAQRQSEPPPSGVRRLARVCALPLALDPGGRSRIDRAVVRFVASETGGVRSPRFIFERELAFEARLEALGRSEPLRALPTTLPAAPHPGCARATHRRDAARKPGHRSGADRGGGRRAHRSGARGALPASGRRHGRRGRRAEPRASTEASCRACSAGRRGRACTWTGWSRRCSARATRSS